jgi:hypothetical protein
MRQSLSTQRPDKQLIDFSQGTMPAMMMMMMMGKVVLREKIEDLERSVFG